jgi:hypothetical protein
MNDVHDILIAETLVTRRLLSELYCMLRELSEAKNSPQRISLDEFVKLLNITKYQLNRIAFHREKFDEFVEKYVSVLESSHELYKANIPRPALIASFLDEITSVESSTDSISFIDAIYSGELFLDGEPSPHKLEPNGCKIICLTPETHTNNCCFAIDHDLDHNLPIKFLRHSFRIPLFPKIDIASYKEFILTLSIACGGDSFIAAKLHSKDHQIFSDELHISNNRVHLRKVCSRDTLHQVLRSEASDLHLIIETWDKRYHRVPIFVYNFDILGV